MNSPITTHVLDTSLGKPAVGIVTTLESQEADGQWKELASGITNGDGRIADLLPASSHLLAGAYRLPYQTGEYFRQMGKDSFYPKITVEFAVTNGGHYHVPLLLSPFGFSTYRGS